MRPTILAFDLEGTLISNAVSQIPRPGLFSFLEWSRAQTARQVMFTTVEETLFRRIANLLVAEGSAPDWFADIGYIRWTGATKDLRYVSSVLGEALLLDDHRAYVHPGQEEWWLEVPLFASPYDAADDGLQVAEHHLKKRLAQCG